MQNIVWYEPSFKNRPTLIILNELSIKMAYESKNVSAYFCQELIQRETFVSVYVLQGVWEIS